MNRSMKRRRSKSPSRGPCPFSYIDQGSLSEVSKACIKEAESELVRLIAGGASTNVPDNQGRTALHLAAERGNTGCCRVLLDSPATDVNALTHKGVSPLMCAVESNCEEVVRLLHDKGAAVDLVDGDGNSCLDRAVENDNLALFRVLLSELEVSPNVASFEGWTIAHSCARKGATEFLREVLQQSGYQYRATDYGITPLHLACQEGHLASAKVLLNRYSYALDLKASDGVTPIFLAAQNRHPELVEYLIEEGASVAVVTANGTVLHSAVIGGHPRCLSLLLEAGADVEGAIGRTEVDTPLSQAVFNNSVPCVTTLLKHGADPLMCSTDPYSSTPLSICFENLTSTGVDDDSSLILQRLLSHMPRETAVVGAASELAKSLQEEDCVELVEAIVKLMPRWSLGEIVPGAVLRALVRHGRVRCLGYLIRCNYTFTRDSVFPLTLQYVVESTAGEDHKHLVHQALVDQVPSFHQTQVFMLRNKSHPVTMNPPKSELLARIGGKTTSPGALVDLCRHRIRSLLPCSRAHPRQWRAYH